MTQIHSICVLFQNCFKEEKSIYVEKTVKRLEEELEEKAENILVFIGYQYFTH